MDDTLRIAIAYRDGIVMAAAHAWPMLTNKQRTEYLEKLRVKLSTDPELLRLSIDIMCFELTNEGTDHEQ